MSNRKDRASNKSTARLADILGVGANPNVPIMFNGDIRSVADIMEEIRQRTSDSQQFLDDLWREQH